MSGLLYKDFISVKGKWIVAAMTGGIVLLLLCVMIDDEEVRSAAAAGLYLLYVVAFLVLLIEVIPAWLLKADEKGTVRNFLYSLPTGRTEYVKEKYIFMGLCDYIVSSYLNFTGMIVYAYFPQDDLQAASALTLVSSLVIMFVVVHALMLPVYLIYGSDSAGSVFTCLSVVLFFGVMIFLFFGDLELLEKIGIFPLIQWLSQHIQVVMAFSIVAPLIAMGIYYASYRVSLKFGGKERAFNG